MRSKLYAVFAIAFNQWLIYVAIVLPVLELPFGPLHHSLRIASPILGFFALWRVSHNPNLIDWVRLGNLTRYFPKNYDEIAALKDWIIKDFTGVAGNLASACLKQEATQKHLSQLRDGFRRFKESFKVSALVDINQYRKQSKDFELGIIGFERELQANDSEVAIQWQSVKLYVDLLLRFKIKPKDYDPTGLLEELKTQERMEKVTT